MPTLEGIVPATVTDQLRMIEELAAAPLEELRPLLSLVLATFLVERRSLEMPNMYVDAIDSVLRRVRSEGRMALAAGGPEASPLLQAIQEQRREISEAIQAGTMTEGGEPEPVSETAYQPRSTAS